MVNIQQAEYIHIYKVHKKTDKSMIHDLMKSLQVRHNKS